MNCLASLEAASGLRPVVVARERANYLLAGCPAAQPFQTARPSRRTQHRGASTGQACRAAIRAQASGDGVTAAAPAAPPASTTAAPPSPLVYAGVAFDMDGTLTVSNIDYTTMRAKTEIPVGDLFTVMESWDDGDRIKRSMDVILELEAQACTTLQAQPGLLELLGFLRASGVKVGLITRNTVESVDAFFGVIGEQWRDAFDLVLTRDNTPHVKPDPRSLLVFAEAWGLKPFEILMVGDSLEDIETANAAGTASCLIAGGGNETTSGPAPPPPLGAVPTFSVDSLAHLQQRLAQCNTALGWGAYGEQRTMSLSSGTWDEEDEEEGALSALLQGVPQLSAAGAPPAGLDFLAALFDGGAVQAASCSFPRIDGARFGVPPDAHPGDRVLHLACGDGALTKLLFARGVQVIGVDEDVEAARRRGLPAVQLAPLALRENALQPELAAMGGKFDAAVFYASGSSSSSSGSWDAGSSGSWGDEAAEAQQQQQAASGLAASWWQSESLAELRRVLKPGGRLCVQAPVGDEAAARAALLAAGFTVRDWERTLDGCARLVAVAP